MRSRLRDQSLRSSAATVLLCALLVGLFGGCGAADVQQRPTIDVFPLPADSNPVGITAGPDGNLWVCLHDAIAKVSMQGQITATFALDGIDPAGIVTGPDGNLWFTAVTDQGPDATVASGSRIGRITPAGVVTYFALPDPTSEPVGIVSGPDSSLWFTEIQGNWLGHITIQGAITEEAPLPTPNSQPDDIAVGPDGNLWFTEPGSNQIGRLTPEGTLAEFPLPTPSAYPSGITTGPDGNLWFTATGTGRESDHTGNKIGRMTVQGALTEYPLSTPNATPGGIVAGPDGNLWFTEIFSNKIGRITPQGGITELPLVSPNRFPSEITVGQDGNLWFTEGHPGDRIGRVRLKP